MNEQHEALDTLDTFDALDFPGADSLVAAGEVAPPAAGTVDAAMAAVRLAAAGESVATDAKRHRRRFAGTRRSRIILSVAAVAAVVAGAIAVPTIPFGDNPPAAGATAASFLHGVADTAAEAPSTDAPYWKVRAKNVTTRAGTFTTTSWQSRSGTIMEGRSAAKSGGTGYVFYPAGREPDAQTAWQVVGMEVKWDDLAELPTDPAALKAYLESGKPTTSKDQAVFSGIFQLLRTPVSPEVRSALYDVLAELPYLRLVGPVKDKAGRAGVALEYDLDDRRSRIVIDPRTAMPLEQRQTILGGPEDGVTYLTTTYLSLESVRKAPKATPINDL